MYAIRSYYGFFISADYDTDRDQWLISLGDLTNNYTVIASTTDFSELLDQTKSFEPNPLNRQEAMLLALNQKTNALDGVTFAGNYVRITSYNVCYTKLLRQ